jgi:hypothetical protein
MTRRIFKLLFERYNVIKEIYFARNLLSVPLHDCRSKFRCGQKLLVCNTAESISQFQVPRRFPRNICTSNKIALATKVHIDEIRMYQQPWL